MSLPLTDRVIMVTGAAGHLGSAVVALLETQGAHIVAADRTAARLDEIMDALADPSRHLRAGGVDFLDPQACAALAERAVSRFGHVDGLVSTVGSFAMASLEDADPDHWDLLYRVNVITTLNLCRAVVPAMRAAGRGSIVTIGAAAAARAGKSTAAYAAAKSAVLRLTESLADELKGEGIRANCVLPGTIDTPPNRAAMPKADPSRWASPEEVAQVIAFLLSDAALGITGAGVPVTGRG